MSFKLTPATWRVGMVILIYAILYMGMEDILPWWLATFLLPLYMLFQPVTPEMLVAYEKTRANGIVFYVVKWSLIVLAILLLLTFIYTAWLGIPFWETARALLQNVFVTVPVIMAVALAWLVRERAWLQRQQEEYQKQAAAAKGRPRRKKK